MTRALTTDEFVARAQEVHRGRGYDYSRTVYVNQTTLVTVICPLHGEFTPQPNNHLTGAQCRSCGNDSRRTKRAHGVERFIQKAQEVHGDRYDYDAVAYVNNKTHVSVTCRAHGPFPVRPDMHVARKQGCSNCGGSKALTTAGFVDRARQIHGDRYEYGMVEYQNMYVLVTIECPDHGPFEQIPHSHLDGHGCSRCRESKGERAVRNALDEWHIAYVQHWRDHDCIFRGRLTFDFALPEHKALIEFDGQQHYKPVKWSKNMTDEAALAAFRIVQARDRAKDEWARANGWTLVRLTQVESVRWDLMTTLGATA